MHQYTQKRLPVRLCNGHIIKLFMVFGPLNMNELSKYDWVTMDSVGKQIFFPFKGLEKEEQKFHLLSQPNNSQEVGMVN